MSVSTTGYQMGHSDPELKRLELQARVFRPLTEAVLRGAGLGPGMRILDVGCGVGDVSLLAAELVESTGQVVGIDISERPLESARRRAGALGLAHVDFRHHGLESLPPEKPFDAVVARLVLTHQPEPVAFLRQMGEHLRPGGLLICHEIDFALGPVAYPPLPLLERVWMWIQGVTEGLSLQLQMGRQLVHLMRQAGLTVEGCLFSGTVGVDAEADADVLRTLTEAARVLLPHMARLGVARADEVDIDTLEQRVLEEARAAGGVFIPLMMTGAWARRPASA